MNKIYKLIPKYSIVPLAVLLVVHFLNFYATRLITNGMRHYDFSIALDLMIPFVPAFIVFYILAFPQWAFGMLYFIRQEKEICFRFIAAALIGEAVCIATFIAAPTALCGEVLRPEITGGDIFSKLTSLIFSVDEPNNLFPSLHCFASWFCFRGIFFLPREKRNKGYMIFSFLFSLLVFASTVFVKQHVFVDIIGGVLLVEIAILLEDMTKARRLIFALDRRLFKNRTPATEDFDEEK